MTAPVQRLVFGTAEDCDVRVVGDPYVSPRHIRVTRTSSGAFLVEDLGATNGTWWITHGRPWTRVHGRVLVQPGDRVMIGRTVIPW